MKKEKKEEKIEKFSPEDTFSSRRNNERRIPGLSDDEK